MKLVICLLEEVIEASLFWCRAFDCHGVQAYPLFARTRSNVYKSDPEYVLPHNALLLLVNDFIMYHAR